MTGVFGVGVTNAFEVLRLYEKPLNSAVILISRLSEKS